MAETQQTYVPFTVYALTDSSLKAVPEGHRLCEVKWRLTKKAEAEGKQKRPAICVALPALPSLQIEPIAFKDALTEALEDMQDNCVGDYLNSLIAENSAINLLGQLIPSSLATVEGLAEAINSAKQSGRLSKELITTHFNASILPALVEALVERGVTDEKDVQQASNRYLAALCTLAAPRATMSPKNAKALLKVAEMGEDNRVQRALLDKLRALSEPKPDNELLDLLA